MLSEWLRTLRMARVYDLAHPMKQGMPQSSNHPRFHMALARRHGDVMRLDGGSAATELIVTGAHVGTHIDALCHISQRGMLYGGVDAAEAQRGGGFSRLGVETISPMLCRGILLDVARLQGMTVLPPAYEVTADDLEQASVREGIELQAGDVVLVRTGWAAYWAEPERFLGHVTGVPGLGVEAASWLGRRGVRATGSDTVAYEQIPPELGHQYLPVHRTLIVDFGINILESMQLEDLAMDRRWEFLFIAIPLKLVGATGSPVRPLAVT